MKKFKIEICRTSYAFDRFEVEAENEKEAKDKAMKMAYDKCFKEVNAEYSIESVESIETK